MTTPERSPGAILRAEREELGVTVREVAETLNLSMGTIDAIETDDLERLPGPVFTRGYVRAYARLLELDPRPLLEHYPKAPDPAPPGPTSEPPVREWIRQRPTAVLGSAAAAALILLLLVVIALWPESEAPSTVGDPAPAGGDLTSELPAAAAVATGPDSDRTVTDGLGAPVPSVAGPGDRAGAAGVAGAARAPDPLPGPIAAEPGTPEPAGPESAEPTEAAPAPFAAVPDAAATTERGPRRITPAGDDLLRFGFSDDCWVEVRSADGARLYSDLNRAGAELALVGEGPFRILLGYAPGVSLVFNGEPVPLTPHTRDNVATLVVGQ